MSGLAFCFFGFIPSSVRLVGEWLVFGRLQVMEMGGRRKSLDVWGLYHGVE